MVSVEFIVISLVTEVIGYTFHTSMLFLMCFKRKTVFKGPYYNVFLIVLVSDLLIFLFMAINIRVPLLFPEFFESHGFFASFNYNMSSYFNVIQFFGHFLLAFNRFTLFWFPLKHESIWRRNWYIYALIGLPFFHICYRLHQPGTFIFASENTVIVTFKDTELFVLTLLMSTIIYVFTTVISAILNILSLFKFYKYKQNGNLINGNEKDLFFVTCLIFVAQVFRLSNTIARPMFQFDQNIVAFLTATLPLFSDLFAWSGSISLIFLSPTTRKEYANFYMRKKSGKFIPTSSYPIIISSNKY